MKFQFTAQRVLDVKQQLLRLARLRRDHLQSRLGSERQQHGELLESLNDAPGCTDHQSSDIDVVAQSQYVDRVYGRIRNIREQIRQTEEELAHADEECVRLAKEAETLEQLREEKLQEFRRERSRREQVRQTDSILHAGLRSGLSRRPESVESPAPDKERM